MTNEGEVQSDATSADQPADPDDQGLPEGAQRALHASREEARTAKREAAQLAARLKELEDRDKSEIERATARMRELEEQNHALLTEKQQRIVSDAVTAEARAAKAINPEAVARLLRGDIAVDDDGNPIGVKAALNRIRSEVPELFNDSAGQVDAGAGKTAPTRPGAEMSDRIRQLAGR